MPCAGLANRMRAMASAITVAAERKALLRIGWKYDYRALEAPFAALFDMTQLPPNVEIIEMGATPDPAWNSSQECNSEEAWLAFDKEAPLLRFKSWAAFYGYSSQEWLTALKSLKPHATLEARANSILLYPLLSIGVHIRRTDHKKSIMRSPSNLFWETMRQAHTVYFYIASDSDEERKYAAHLFPKRILMHEDAVLERNSITGCECAMVDFLCLSKCKYIIGSYGSSFSEIAALYGGISYFAIQT
jgi:hypothetical protein